MKIFKKISSIFKAIYDLFYYCIQLLRFIIKYKVILIITCILTFLTYKFHIYQVRENKLLTIRTTISDTTWSEKEHVNNYITSFGLIAVEEGMKYRIPPSIKLAQGMLESGNGTSILAKNANNHFGIKCHSSWKGETYYLKDDDLRNGKLVKSCFRKYLTVQESFREHSKFLYKNKRYSSLFQYTSYEKWSEGLQDAGYATDVTYSRTLKKIILKNNLNILDKLTFGI